MPALVLMKDPKDKRKFLVIDTRQLNEEGLEEEYKAMVMRYVPFGVPWEEESEFDRMPTDRRLEVSA